MNILGVKEHLRSEIRTKKLAKQAKNNNNNRKTQAGPCINNLKNSGVCMNYNLRAVKDLQLK